MTPEQAIKHGPVITWFVNNPDKSIWFKAYDTEGWHETTAPLWHIAATYVQNDEYAELRKHLADDKNIIYKFGTWESDGEERWLDLKVNPTSVNYGNDFYNFKWKFKEDVNLIEVHKGEYRIKPAEPKFKVGDWVRNGDRVLKYTSKDEAYDINNPTHGKHDELWEPQEGDEVVCLLSDGIRLGKVFKNDIGDLAILGSGTNSLPLAMFDNVIPYIGQDFEEML